jgi:hypothetical protein
VNQSPIDLGQTGQKLSDQARSYASAARHGFPSSALLTRIREEKEHACLIFPNPRANVLLASDIAK